MRVDVRLLLVLGAMVLCCGPFSAAQQTGAKSQESGAHGGQKGDEDLGQLAKELEAAEQQAASDAAKARDAAQQTMESYQDRAKRQAIEARDRLLKDPLWRPTHKQVNRLEIPGSLNNMCLDSQGRILACCGDKKIRVLAHDGQLLATYSLAFVPEAISVRERDGAIFVGGQGQLVRMSSDGQLEEKSAFPPPPTEEERQAIVERMLKQVEAQIKQMQQMAKGIKSQLDEVQKELAKEPPAEEEAKKIAAMAEEDLYGHVGGITMTEDQLVMTFAKDTSTGIKARVLEMYLQQLGGVDIEQQKEAMEKQVRSQAEQLVGAATYTGLAAGDEDLFVICSGPGYAYNAWRLTHDFQQPKMILAGLSGCCGQMDCQTHDGNLWLAMNTQHKVLCYDRDGKEISGFGKNDGAAADGFGGCCEPKNLRFSKDGKYVYCAQSGPPVCVKRFTLDGTFQDVVCFPIYETGCVRVAVDASGDTFFMMSPSESAVYVFQPDESANTGVSE